MVLHFTSGTQSKIFPIPGLSIGFWSSGDQDPCPFHDHDFVEVAIATKGKGKHSFEGTTLPVSTGDVFVVEAGCTHAWREVQDLGIINIMIADFDGVPMLADLRAHPGFGALFIHEPSLREQQQGQARLHLSPDELAEAVRLADRLNDALQRVEAPHPTVATIVFLDLVVFLCEAYVSEPPRARQTVLRVSEAIRHLEENLQSPLNPAELASIMHVSRATFYRLFRNATGVSPSNYLNRLRVDEACRRLRRSDESVGSIAYDVGFSDSNYFSTVFRRFKGITPVQYRRGAC